MQNIVSFFTCNTCCICHFCEC